MNLLHVFLRRTQCSPERKKNSCALLAWSYLFLPAHSERRQLPHLPQLPWQLVVVPRKALELVATPTNYSWRENPGPIQLQQRFAPHPTAMSELAAAESGGRFSLYSTDTEYQARPMLNGVGAWAFYENTRVDDFNTRSVFHYKYFT